MVHCNRVLQIVLLLTLSIFLSSSVLAHSPYLMINNNEDGTIDITAGYSNGASGAGVNILLKSKKSGKILWQGRLDSLGEITCPKQRETYIIVFDGGPGHILEKEGIVLTERDSVPEKHVDAKTSAMPKEKVSKKLEGLSVTPVTRLYPLDKDFEYIKNILPEPILIQDSNGIIRAVTITQGYRYHHGKGLEKIIKRLEEKRKNAAVDFKINDVGLCFGVTSGYLSLKFAISELFGKEIPKADDFRITARGKMCSGVMDMYSLYFGKRISNQETIISNQRELVFTAERLSTGKKIIFKYNLKVIPELEKFTLAKSNPKKFKDVDFMKLKSEIIRKLFLTKDFGYFEKTGGR